MADKCSEIISDFLSSGLTKPQIHEKLKGTPCDIIGGNIEGNLGIGTFDIRKSFLNTVKNIGVVTSNPTKSVKEVAPINPFDLNSLNRGVQGISDGVDGLGRKINHHIGGIFHGVGGFFKQVSGFDKIKDSLTSPEDDD